MLRSPKETLTSRGRLLILIIQQLGQEKGFLSSREVIKVSLFMVLRHFVAKFFGESKETL